MMALVMMQLELDWVTHPFINEHPPYPHYGYLTIYIKIFQTPPIFQFFGSPYPLTFVNVVGFQTIICPSPEN